MNANAVYIQQKYPRAALQVAGDEFFAAQSERRKDIELEDNISGDLAMSDGKRLLNISKGTLIQVRVLGRFPTLESTIEAISALSSKVDTEPRMDDPRRNYIRRTSPTNPSIPKTIK